METDLLILAGGMGSRLGGNVPKWLTNIIDMSLIDYLNQTLNSLKFNKKYIVINKKHEKYINQIPLDFEIFIQDENYKGSGAPLKSIYKKINNHNNILILPCDMPFIDINTLEELMQRRNSLIYSTIDNNTSYGSVVINDEKFIQIVEDEKTSNINIGIYNLYGNSIIEALNKLNANLEDDEYRLTDLINIIAKNEVIMPIYKKYSFNYLNINTKRDLNEATLYLSKINKSKFKNVYFEGNEIILGSLVKIEDGVSILGNSKIINNTFIKNNTIINNSYLNNVVINQDSNITDSKIADSYIGKNAFIGPYANILDKAVLYDNVKIGNFVEIKRSTIKENVRILHHAYIADAFIGNNTNIGCGVVTCNFDGENKHQTIIKNNCFIGSNSNLIAPVIIEDNAIIGAGSTITKNVLKNKKIICKATIIEKDC